MSANDAVQAPAWQPLPEWQREAAAETLRARARWPHALLITGRRGIGKRILAMHFAQALLCEEPRADGGACGHCASCAYVVAGTHPDLRVIEPVEIDEEGNRTALDAILVERIRELTEFTQLTAHRQRAKVALIVPAEAMNPHAQNALLKTLEEPSPATYLILVAHQPRRIAPTIVSRCRLMMAPEPGQSAALAWLDAQGVPQPRSLLAQAGGAPLLAMTLADAALQQEREQLLDELAEPQRLEPAFLGARIDSYGKDERKARLGDVLYWLSTWTADLAAVASGGTPHFNPDRRDVVVQLAAKVAPLKLFRYYRALLEQRALIGHPLQPRLVAEALLVEYRSLFARGEAG